MSAGNIRIRLRNAVVVAVALSALGGCMSSKIVEGRKRFYNGDTAAAVETFTSIKDKKGKDRILILLEYGLALHVAGMYPESVEVLMEADKVIEAEDVVHLAEETGSLVSNEMMTTYRPESFERVLVHTYLAINFILMDDWSAARVEARKTLKILDSLDEDLRDQPFARYICALAFDLMDDTDSAYIEYKKVTKAAPYAVPAYRELHRIAILRGDGSDARKWARKIRDNGGVAESDPEPPNLIVFVGAGRSPVKIEINTVVPPHVNRFVIPDYKSSGSRAHHATLSVEEGGGEKSYVLTDLDPLAQKTLKKRIAKEIAKEVARVAAKEVIARQLEDQSPLLGLGARVVFFASEAADVRSWETLPRYMSVITKRLPPGTYNITIEFRSAGGAPVGTTIQREITIIENRRTVLSVRSVK